MLTWFHETVGSNVLFFYGLGCSFLNLLNLKFLVWPSIFTPL